VKIYYSEEARYGVLHRDNDKILKDLKEAMKLYKNCVVKSKQFFL